MLVTVPRGYDAAIARGWPGDIAYVARGWLVRYMSRSESAVTSV